MHYERLLLLKSYAQEHKNAANILAELYADDAQKSGIIQDVQAKGLSSPNFYRFSRLCILTLCNKNLDLTPQQSRGLINGSLGASTLLYTQMVMGSPLSTDAQVQVKPKDARDKISHNYPSSMTKVQCFTLFSRIEQSGLLADYGDFLDKQSGTLWAPQQGPKIAPPFPKALLDYFSAWVKEHSTPVHKPPKIRRMHVDDLLPIGHKENEGLRGAFDKTKKRENRVIIAPAEKRDKWFEDALLLRHDIDWKNTFIIDSPNAHGSKERDQYIFFHIVKTDGQITQAAICNRPANSQDHSNASLIWKGDRLSVDDLDGMTIQKLKSDIEPRRVPCRSKEYLVKTLCDLLDAEEIPPYKIKRMDWKDPDTVSALQQTIISYYTEYGEPPTQYSGLIDHDEAHTLYKDRTSWSNVGAAINRGLIPSIQNRTFAVHVDEVIEKYNANASIVAKPDEFDI